MLALACVGNLYWKCSKWIVDGSELVSSLNADCIVILWCRLRGICSHVSLFTSQMTLTMCISLPSLMSGHYESFLGSSGEREWKRQTDMITAVGKILSHENIISTFVPHLNYWSFFFKYRHAYLADLIYV